MITLSVLFQGLLDCIRVFSSLSALTVTGRFKSMGVDRKRGKIISNGEISCTQGSVGKIPSILSAHKSMGKMPNMMPVVNVDR